MARKLIDISVALQITYLDHNVGALNFCQVFGVTRDQLPDGAGPAVEQVAQRDDEDEASGISNLRRGHDHADGRGTDGKFACHRVE